MTTRIEKQIYPTPHKFVRHKNANSHAGLTLVELLIALVIGLFIIGGSVRVMLDGKNNFFLEQELAYIQENARFITDEIAFEIRMAGYKGCSVNARIANVISGDKNAQWMFSSSGVKGYRSNEASMPSHFNQAKENTDVLIINRGEMEENTTLSLHNTTNNRLELNGSHRFSPGEGALIANADCSHITLFRITDTGSRYLEFDTTNNCIENLAINRGQSFNCENIPNNYTPKTFAAGSSLLHYQSSAYYLKDSHITGLPTLYKESVNFHSDGTMHSVSQALISGIDDFDITYGVDTNNDGDLDQYLDASSINQSTASELWSKVISVSITAILRSQRAHHNQNTAVDLGGGYTYNDTFSRHKVVHTTSIRNREL